MIHAFFDTTKVLGTFEIEGEQYEVCAEAIANHERSTNLVTVNLKAFLRAMKHDHLGERNTPDWLPVDQTVTEHGEIEEAHELTNEIFASWCHKVAGSLPQ